MISIRGLTKRYGAATALSNLNLEIPEGERFGLVGPNGAGKTTTLKILATLLRPTSGSAHIAEHSVADTPDVIKRLVGYVPDTPALYEKLTGAEFLRFISDVRQLRDVRRVRLLLDLLMLDEVADDLVETYSHGMRKRLGIAAALLHRPRVLLLDEPTGGLDPAAAGLVKDILGELPDQGATVLLCSHELGLVQQTCDRVGIVHRGALAAVGSPDELCAEFNGASLEDVFLDVTEARVKRSVSGIWEDAE